MSLVKADSDILRFIGVTVQMNFPLPGTVKSVYSWLSFASSSCQSLVS